MKLNVGMSVECHDGNQYGITDRTKDNYVVGHGLGNSGNQRLFKPNGQYAGSDREKNVAEIL